MKIFITTLIISSVICACSTIPKKQAEFPIIKEGTYLTGGCVGRIGAAARADFNNLRNIARDDDGRTQCICEIKQEPCGTNPDGSSIMCEKLKCSYR